MRDQPTSNREAELPAPPRIGSGDWLGLRLIGIMTRHTSHANGMCLLDIAEKAKLPWPQVRLKLSRMEQQKIVHHFFRHEDSDWPNSLWYVSVPVPLKADTANAGTESSPNIPS